MNALETIALRMDGMPQDTIDEVAKALPAAAALIQHIQNNGDLVQKWLALINESQPLMPRTLVLVNEAIKEIDAILPAAQKVAAFLQQS